MVMHHAAAAQRYVFDPSVGAYYDRMTGQYIMSVATAPTSTPSGDTTFLAANQPPTEEFATGPSTMGGGPASVQAVPMSTIDSGQVQARQHPGEPLPNYLVPPDYQLAERGQVPGMGAPGSIVGGDATTQQMPVPPNLYPGSGATPAPTTSGRSTGGGTTSGGGYDSGYGSSYGGRRSYGGGYDSGYSTSRSSFGDTGDPMDNLPAYADGSRHPAQTGSGLVPGGQFNDGTSSADYRRRRYGGMSTQQAYYNRKFDDQPLRYLAGFAYEDKPPSLAQQIGWNIRGQVEQRAMGSAMGQQPGMGGPQGVPTTATAGVPGMPGGGMGPAGMRRMRGWAGQQGFTPAAMQDIYYNPQWLYPYINRGLRPGTALYNQVDDLLSPNMQSLWTATAGSRARAGTGPDHYANWVNRAVRGYTTPGGRVFNGNRLIRNLTMPNRGSTQWQAQQGQTFGENAYNLQNQIGSVASVTMNPMAASATMSYLDTLLNTAGSKNLRRGPQRQIDPGMHVARHLFR